MYKSPIELITSEVMSTVVKSQEEQLIARAAERRWIGRVKKMRDRLIELIREAKDHPEKTCPRWELPTCGGCDYNQGDECDRTARLADFLLKNGVSVTSAKIKTSLPEATRQTVLDSFMKGSED